MKVEGGWIRCDGCCTMEIKRKPLVIRGEMTTRPDEGTRDRFFDIVLPPSVSKFTGKPDGRYKGCAREGLPGVLLPMHLCPGCAIDIKKCVEFTIGKALIGKTAEAPQLCDAIQITALGDPMQLKPGPLREHLLTVKSRDVFPKTVEH